MYRLVEESELRRFIEVDMIYNELYTYGTDDLIMRFPDIDDIEKKLNEYKECDD